MKINLDGIFKDIKRILDAPIKRDVKAPSAHAFDKILASISPRKAENLKSLNDLVSNEEGLASKASPPDQRMASIRYDAPKLEAPDPLPIQSVSIPPGTESSVKTPTLIDARRIEPAAELKVQKREKISEINQLARRVGLEQGIDPALSMSIISAESSFNSQAVSRDGHASKGLMQLLDSTGTQYHELGRLKEKYNPFDPEQNVKLGVSYLRYLHDIFGKETSLPNDQVTFAAANSSSLEKLAVAAYNAGEGRVASAQARAKQQGFDPSQYENIRRYLPESTVQYVERVLSEKGRFSAEMEG